jgi:hypothetical protein
VALVTFARRSQRNTDKIQKRKYGFSLDQKSREQ